MSKLYKVEKDGEKFIVKYSRVIKDINNIDVTIPYKSYEKTVAQIDDEIAKLQDDITRFEAKIVELQKEKTEIAKVQ